MSGEVDFSKDYWLEFPEHRYVFDDIYKKPDGDKLMWCAYMYVHPDSSIAIELDEIKKINYINSVFKGFKFDPKANKKHIDKYISFIPVVEMQFKRMFLDLKASVDYILDLARNKDNIHTKNVLMKQVQDRMDGLIEAEAKARISRSERKKAKRNYMPSMVEADFSDPTAAMG
jgi:hypothetical protein